MRLIPVVVAVAVLAGCLGTQHGTSAVPRGGMDDPVCHGTLHGLDLRTATVLEVQKALTEHRFTSVELVDAYLARVAAFDDAPLNLNAILTLDPTAREQAARLDAERAAGHVRGPLHGVAVVLKDNIGTNDTYTSAGSIALATNLPPKDSTLVARLRTAGAVILGKTNLNEFSNWMSSNMPMGYSSNGGQTVNAYTGGSPGGSSAGSGVAGSMAYSTVAIGTDTTGSVTYPSNMNSLAGLRPSHPLVSHTGIIPIIPQFDEAGPMGRHVEDVAVVLGTIVGPDPTDPLTASSAGHTLVDYTTRLSPDALKGVRLGYDDSANDAPFVVVRQQLASLGAVLVPVKIDPDAMSQAGTGEIAGLAFNEFKYSINHYLAADAGPGLPVKDLAGIIAYNDAHKDKAKYGQDYLQLSDATPGRREITDAAVPAVWANSRAVADAMFQQNNVQALIGLTGDLTPYSPFTAAAGYPNMVVPAGYQGKVPQGLSFFGPMWSDEDLLRYAYAYEQGTHLRQMPETLNGDILGKVCAGGLPPASASDTRAMPMAEYAPKYMP